MAIKYYNLEGVAKWAKVFEDNRDLVGFEGAAKEWDGTYSIDVYLDKEALSKFKDTGSRVRPKLNEDGEMFVTFKRKHGGPTAEWAGGPPRVMKADRKTPHSFEEDGHIGNGSDVMVRIAVYDTKYGKGTRLEGVVVKNQVQLERGPNPDDFFDTDLDPTAGEVPF